MIGRRQFGETLAEILGGAIEAQRHLLPVMRISSMELELPIEARITIDETGPVLVGDVPLMRVRTDFDPPPARLSVGVECSGGAR